ncbi:MAG: peptidoglycan bridge formation glycyltransferase FemA/FemB family protein [Patescibacteria group bacterium]|jgi:lipid II:glycine glycyltransferase (peptidoglycan interpeptide bridge formation enzyme)
MELHVNQGLEPKSWDYFVLQHPEANLLQSWQWGEFQKSLGNKIWRLGVADQGQTIAQLLIIKLPLRFGRHIFYSPRALLLNKTLPAHQQHQAMKLIIEKIHSLAASEKILLFRTDPPLPPDDTTSLSIYKSLGFVLSPKSTQPKTSLWLDISSRSINLLMQMKPKTRYNIRLAEKKEITVRETTQPKDIAIFNQLMHETALRDRFTPHPDNYYHQQLAILGAQNALSLFIAYDQEIPLAAALVSWFGPVASYLHGASSNQTREKQAPYLLHWEIIKAAKKRDCTVYDLGGINLAHNSAWAGITRFKLGFGGNPTTYLGNLELPLNKPWFKLYQLLTYKKYV